MADIPLYDGETITLHWGTLAWVCQVYRSDECCVRCRGATVWIDPAWQNTGTAHGLRDPTGHGDVEADPSPDPGRRYS
jgi:hypothetical protein